MSFPRAGITLAVLGWLAFACAARAARSEIGDLIVLSVSGARSSFLVRAMRGGSVLVGYGTIADSVCELHLVRLRDAGVEGLPPPPDPAAFQKELRCSEGRVAGSYAAVILPAAILAGCDLDVEGGEQVSCDLAHALQSIRVLADRGGSYAEPIEVAAAKRIIGELLADSLSRMEKADGVAGAEHNTGTPWDPVDILKVVRQAVARGMIDCGLASNREISSVRELRLAVIADLGADPESPGTCARLIELSMDKDGVVRAKAAYMLAGICGGRSSAAAEAVRAYLRREPDPESRRIVGDALGAAIDAEAKRAIETPTGHAW